jgi:hypothetical protein
MRGRSSNSPQQLYPFYSAQQVLLLHRPEYIRSRLAGNNYFGLPKLGERYTEALRAAAGKIDDATAGLPE